MQLHMWQFCLVKRILFSVLIWKFLKKTKVYFLQKYFWEVSKTTAKDDVIKIGKVLSAIYGPKALRTRRSFILSTILCIMLAFESRYEHLYMS